MKKYTYIMKRTESVTSKQDTVSFVASTASPDRYGDIIDQKGWMLENYKKNPVVLLNHDSNQLPIGKGHVHVRDAQLVIDVQFDQEDERAREVERKAKKGFMLFLLVFVLWRANLDQNFLNLINTMAREECTIANLNC